MCTATALRKRRSGISGRESRRKADEQCGTEALLDIGIHRAEDPVHLVLAQLRQRNLAAQEITLDKSALAKRELKEGVSLMPPGLVANLPVDDFAALLSFLEELNAKYSAK